MILEPNEHFGDHPSEEEIGQVIDGSLGGTVRIGSWKHHEKQHEHDSRFIRCAHLPVALGRRQLGLPHARLRPVHCPWGREEPHTGPNHEAGRIPFMSTLGRYSKSQLHQGPHATA